MIRRASFLVVSLVVLALLAAGCKMTRAPGAPTQDPLSGANYPKITATPGLGNFTFDEPPVIRSGEGQPMTVSVPVRLGDTHDVAAQYRFLFFDASGMPIRPEMEWRYVVLPARTRINLTGTALDATAKDWRLEIRPAR